MRSTCQDHTGLGGLERVVQLRYSTIMILTAANVMTVVMTIYYSLYCDATFATEILGGNKLHLFP